MHLIHQANGTIHSAGRERETRIHSLLSWQPQLLCCILQERGSLHTCYRCHGLHKAARFVHSSHCNLLLHSFILLRDWRHLSPICSGSGSLNCCNVSRWHVFVALSCWVLPDPCRWRGRSPMKLGSFGPDLLFAGGGQLMEVGDAHVLL